MMDEMATAATSQPPLQTTHFDISVTIAASCAEG